MITWYQSTVWSLVGKKAPSNIRMYKSGAFWKTWKHRAAFPSPPVKISLITTDWLIEGDLLYRSHSRAWWTIEEGQEKKSIHWFGRGRGVLWLDFLSLSPWSLPLSNQLFPFPFFLLFCCRFHCSLWVPCMERVVSANSNESFHFCY